MKEAYVRAVNSTTPIRNVVLIRVFELVLMFLRLSFRMHKRRYYFENDVKG